MLQRLLQLRNYPGAERPTEPGPAKVFQGVIDLRLGLPA
jgi:hypothetical protein